MPKLTERKANKRGPTRQSREFIEAAATPGMSPTQALKVTKVKGMKRDGNGSQVLANDNPGDPKHGSPNNFDHIVAYRKNRVLREHIDERKKLALQFCDVTPEMVIGATAMRAFGSPDGAFDEHGRFNMQLARDSGAIHLLKKLKMTRSGLEAEFYSNESAQQQLANYMGMEIAPKPNDDTASLKAGIESVAVAIANERHTEVTALIRVEAWERVTKWVEDSKARYSPEAMKEVKKLYAGDDVDSGDDNTVDGELLGVADVAAPAAVHNGSGPSNSKR